MMETGENPVLSRNCKSRCVRESQVDHKDMRILWDAEDSSLREKSGLMGDKVKYLFPGVEPADFSKQRVFYF